MKLDVAICSVRAKSLLELIESLEPYLKEINSVICIIDGAKSYDKNLKKISEIPKYQVIVNQENKGLSYSRNLAMNLSSSDYILYLDDDVLLKSNIFLTAKKYFLQGYDVLGFKLVAPKAYERKMKLLPKGYSYLFGVHTNQNRIWGACFGFNLKIAKQYQLKFREGLGRKGKELQSGDDSFFVKELIEKKCNSILIHESLIHNFPDNRLKLGYIFKRIFWQGRCEIRQEQFVTGLKKEIGRCSINDDGVLKRIISLPLLCIFLLGSLYEICQKGKNIWER